MTTRRRLRALMSVVVVLLVSAVATTLATGTSHATTSGAGTVPVTKTKTVTRINLDNGKNDVVDKRKITLHVSQTNDLRGRQEISVSWSGAHPTGGIVANQNSAGGRNEEYPFVLLECRGLDSTSVKSAERVSPQTCWTQDWTERFQNTYQTDFPPYRLDRYGTVADRSALADVPSPYPAACKIELAPVEHWVPFVAADGQVYNEGDLGCGGTPPESQAAGGSALPSNETFGVTGLDGRGSADFDVWTSAENASLGCTQTVACSLVAVPIMGISCDTAAAGLPAADRPSSDEADKVNSACEAKGAFAPGQLMPATPGLWNLTDTGSLWWSASNWRNRISVPLSFAVPADACDAVSASNDIDVYGSELMIPATTQWSPHFCLNSKLFKFTHVQLGEPEARNLVATDSAEAAFISDPPAKGYGRPVVNAPVALTGFAISYVIDGTNTQPYTKLRLNARLLAKLMTESYPAIDPVQGEDPHLEDNPLNITLDPEFQKLNPGAPKDIDASEAAAALLSISSDSDVMEALTTYINDNAAARAWLNGKPDPWGMTVNPAYADIKLPVDKWPLLSTFEPKQWYASDNNDCLRNTPVPYLPLVAAPLASLEEVSEAMQFSIAQSTTSCSQIDGTSLGEKLIAIGRQTPGYRFMIGITSLADTYQYKLGTAALQTSSSASFAKPDDASLRAAASFLKPDTSTGTWPVPVDQLVTDKKASKAYPGTMVVYAAVPTSGLSKVDAHDYAQLLDFAATSGQTPGLDVGELPPGYLPLTKANGLEQLAAYTKAAAGAVAAQKGALPSLTDPNPATSSSPTPTPTPSTSTESAAPSDTSSVPAVTPPSSAAVTTTPAPGSSPAIASPPNVVAAALGKTLGIKVSGGLAVIIVLGLAILGGAGVPVTYLIGRKRGRW